MASADQIVEWLTVPGRVAGETIGAVASGLRPDHVTETENVSTDTFGVVMLVVVAGALVALLLYVWGR